MSQQSGALPGSRGRRHCLISELIDTFDLETSAGSSAVDFPNWSDGSAETIRLLPAVDTPLAILVTDFSGVLVRFRRSRFA